jgi:hypothetical protein
MRFYVETKAPAEYGGRMEPLLVDELTRLGVVLGGDPDPRRSPVIVQSFDAQSLVAVRQLAPSLPLALLSFASPDPAAVATADLEVFAPGGDQFVLAPDVVAAIHDAGRELHTWTVDDPARMGALVDGGVDGFFSNDPATARAVVDQRGRGSGRTPIEAPDLSAHAPGCPEGMGMGIVRDEPEDTSTTTAASAADASASDSSGSSSSTGWIVGGAVALGALFVVGVALARRRATP